MKNMMENEKNDSNENILVLAQNANFTPIEKYCFMEGNNGVKKREIYLYC